MTITVGAAARNAVQAQAREPKPAKAQAQSTDAQAGSEAQPQAGRQEKKSAANVALTPALRQAVQLVAGPLGEVAVTMAAGAVGALLDTRA